MSKTPTYYISHSIDKKDVKNGDHLRVARKFGFYWHHGMAIEYRCISEHLEMINFTRRYRGKNDLPSFDPSDVLIVEQNRSPDGLCVVTVEEFHKGSTLRLVKYDVSPFEHTFKVKGSTILERGIEVEKSVQRALDHLQKQYELESSGEKTHWIYDVETSNCETFVFYCKGVMGFDNNYSIQVVLLSQNVAGGLSIVGKEAFGIFRHLRIASRQIMDLAKQASAFSDVSQIALDVSKILKGLAGAGIGVGIQFASEMIFLLVCWLVRNSKLAITTATFFKELLKLIGKNAASFAGSLFGLLFGSSGGPLAIVTAILGSIVGAQIGLQLTSLFIATHDKSKMNKRETKLICMEEKKQKGEEEIGSEGKGEESKRLLEFEVGDEIFVLKDEENATQIEIGVDSVTVVEST